MQHPSLTRGAVALAGATALTMPLLAASPGLSTATGATHRPAAHAQRLSGLTPSWATSSHLRGSATRTQRVTFEVQLRLRHAAQAQRRAVAVSTPGSALSGDYLSSAAFDARYAPTRATVARVRSFLSGHGFTLGSVPRNRRFVEATGTVAQVESAFATRLSTYRIRGMNLRAPSTSVTVPASIASRVLTITGLDQSTLLIRPGTVRPSVTPDASSACSHYWAQHSERLPKAYGRRSFPTYVCGYSAKALQSAYGMAKLIHHGQAGKGTKVAIIDAYASPTIVKDANRLFTGHGTHRFGKGQFSQIHFKPFRDQRACGGAAGWHGEETLDVESVHAMAPAAKQVYVGGYNCGAGLTKALNFLVANFDNRKAHKAFGTSMISNSYSGVEAQSGRAYLRAEHSILIQAANQGVGVYFATGDHGDNRAAGLSKHRTVGYPSSDSLATAVGGTSLAVGKAGHLLFQTGGGDKVDQVGSGGYTEKLPGRFYAGAGGGRSIKFRQLPYQHGVVPHKLARGAHRLVRTVPDVAMDADPFTGFLVGQTVKGRYTVTTIGGTSLATPLFVGVQAVTQGKFKRIGFANPKLYALRKFAYRDVRPGKTRAVGVGANLVTFGRDSSLLVRKRYDLVTGRGTPRGSVFVKAERKHVRH